MHLLLVDVRFCNPLVEQIPLKMYIVPFWIFTFFFLRRQLVAGNFD